MAYRDRQCGHLQARKIPAMPPPQQLGPLAPYMGTLMECANAYEEASLDGAFTSACDFVTWLDVEVRRTVQFGSGSSLPVVRPDPPRRVA
jgi:hypothetical protein